MKTRTLYASALVMLGVLATAQVWLSHLRIEASQQTYLLQQEITKQLDKIQGLGLEYASLSSPNRLRQLAHNKLGMRAPHPIQVLHP